MEGRENGRKKRRGGKNSGGGIEWRGREG